jgi:hypothetical protein
VSVCVFASIYVSVCNCAGVGGGHISGRDSPKDWICVSESLPAFKFATHMLIS